MTRGGRLYDYDLISIGSGAGGGVAAHILARQGKKVAIVEESAVGGECPNFGCVPTKALLHAAELYRSAQKAKDFGIKVSALNFNYATIKKWKDAAVKNTGVGEGERAYVRDGIAVIKGHAHFLSPSEISVNGRRYTSKKFIIATGTDQFVPPIEGLDEAGFITYRQAIDLTKPLKKVLVIGGGAIGCEFTQLFASFGAKVTQVELAPRLLAREDGEIGELVQAIFEQLLNVDVYTGSEVIKVEKKARNKIVHFRTGKQVKKVIVDEIMVATGKVPRVDLGLENAGVNYDRHGIKVNSYMQTSNKNIYAAGDVTGQFMFTHMASYQSRIAAHNLFAIKNRRVRAKYHAVPRVCFLDPEVAAVGYSEDELKAQKIKYKSAVAPISIVGRSNVTDSDIGFVKIIASPQDVVLGASIVAPRAGEMIHELSIAVQNHLKLSAITDTIHAFPTWSEAIRVAANKLI